MLKPIVLLLFVPALSIAQPTQQPVQQPLQIKVTVKVGGAVRTHDLAISDHGCNRAEEKTAAYEDHINVCTRPQQANVLVEVSWSTRSGTTEYRTTSSTVMARKGAKVEVGRAGTRFVLET